MYPAELNFAPKQKGSIASQGLQIEVVRLARIPQTNRAPPAGSLLDPPANTLRHGEIGAICRPRQKRAAKSHRGKSSPSHALRKWSSRRRCPTREFLRFPRTNGDDGYSI